MIERKRIFNILSRFTKYYQHYDTNKLTTQSLTDAPEPEKEPEPEIEEEKPAVKTEPLTEEIDIPLETLHTDVDLKKEELEDVKDEFETFEHNIEEDIKRGIKRRASSAFSDNGDEDFKGFDDIKIEIKTEDYSRVLGEF